MRVFLALVFVFFVQLLEAQKFGLSIESGPTFGMLRKDQTDASFKHETFYSMGSGMSNNLLLHVFPDSTHWYYCGGIEWYQSNQITTAFAKLSDSGSYMANSRNLNSFRVQAQLAYSFSFARFKLDLRAGFLVPVFSSNKEYQYVNDTSYNSMTLVRLQNYPSLGFKGGVNFSGALIPSNRLRWFLNIDLTLLNSKVKSAKVIEYKDTRGRQLSEVYSSTALQETLYRKDPTLIRNNQEVLPNRFDKNQATDKLTYTQSLSSVNIKFGFIFHF